MCVVCAELSDEWMHVIFLHTVELLRNNVTAPAPAIEPCSEFM